MFISNEVSEIYIFFFTTGSICYNCLYLERFPVHRSLGNYKNIGIVGLIYVRGKGGACCFCNKCLLSMQMRRSYQRSATSETRSYAPRAALPRAYRHPAIDSQLLKILPLCSSATDVTRSRRRLFAILVYFNEMRKLIWSVLSKTSNCETDCLLNTILIIPD